VFQALLSFAQQSHQAPSPASTAATAAFPDHAGCQRLPTGLVLAGGVNSADHCRTFPNLAAYLRRHGCYVALLQPHTFGKGPGDAIGETLRQMSGLTESRAEHMAALQQWYRDETAAGAAGPAPAAEEDQVEAAAAAGGSKPEARHLRQRAPAGGRPAATAQQLANRQRPLVVIVEGTESVDCHCLRDFILTASEVRTCLSSAAAGSMGRAWGCRLFGKPEAGVISSTAATGTF
jgi:origin recognition complex subunit 3